MGFLAVLATWFFGPFSLAGPELCKERNVHVYIENTAYAPERQYRLSGKASNQNLSFELESPKPQAQYQPVYLNLETDGHFVETAYSMYMQPWSVPTYMGQQFSRLLSDYAVNFYTYNQVTLDHLGRSSSQSSDFLLSEKKSRHDLFGRFLKRNGQYHIFLDQNHSAGDGVFTLIHELAHIFDRRSIELRLGVIAGKNGLSVREHAPNLYKWLLEMRAELAEFQYYGELVKAQKKFGLEDFCNSTNGRVVFRDLPRDYSEFVKSNGKVKSTKFARDHFEKFFPEKRSCKQGLCTKLKFVEGQRALYQLAGGGYSESYVLDRGTDFTSWFTRQAVDGDGWPLVARAFYEPMHYTDGSPLDKNIQARAAIEKEIKALGFKNREQLLNRSGLLDPIELIPLPEVNCDVHRDYCDFLNKQHEGNSDGKDGDGGNSESDGKDGDGGNKGHDHD